MINIQNKWLTLFMVLIASTMLGILYAWSIFVAPLEEMFQWERRETTLTFSFMMVFLGLGMFSGGKILEKIGPVKTAMLGGLLLGLGFFLASYTASLTWLYLTYGILAGYGLGLTNIVPISTALRWFPNNKGLICGLTTMFLAFGTFILGSKLSPYLIDVYGITQCFKILGIIFVVAIFVTAQFFSYPKLENANKAKTNANATLWGCTTIEMLKTKTAWVMILWGLSIQIGGLMIIGHIVPYAQDQGLIRSLALTAMTAYALANGVGRLFFGSIFDGLGRKISMSTCSLFMLIGLICLTYLPGYFGYVGLLVSVIPIAMAYGGTVAHFGALTASFFGPKHFGMNYGFFTFPGVIAGLVGPILAASVKDSTGNYKTAILIGAAISVMALICSLILKEPTKKHVSTN